jgi:hypothetical protein
LQQELACSERSNLKVYFANNRKYLRFQNQDPLKQGLKLKCHINAPDIQYPSKSRSTKTRIETKRFVVFE